LTSKEASQLARAQPDNIHCRDHHLYQKFLNASFVDNNVTAGWVNTIQQSITQSVLSAYITFGFPSEDL
jgi:hypothetical protein